MHKIACGVRFITTVGSYFAHRTTPTHPVVGKFRFLWWNFPLFLISAIVAFEVTPKADFERSMSRFEWITEISLSLSENGAMCDSLLDFAFQEKMVTFVLEIYFNYNLCVIWYQERIVVVYFADQVVRVLLFIKSQQIVILKMSICMPQAYCNGTIFAPQMEWK